MRSPLNLRPNISLTHSFPTFKITIPEPHPRPHPSPKCHPPPSVRCPPLAAVHDLYTNGLHHLYEPTQLALLKNIYGGLLFSFAGLFSLVATCGSPGLEPGLQRLLQGATFPLGLVVAYFIGAELFTGYPMWLAICALQRKGKPVQYLRVLLVSWVGNLGGAVGGAALFSYATGVLHETPWRDGLVQQVRSDIVEARWEIILLKAIGCGCLVRASFPWRRRGFFFGLGGWAYEDTTGTPLGLWMFLRGNR